MTRQQRYRYEMFVRVRDFGAAHKELFPESSTGGQWFAEVSGAVAAIDGHLKNRIVAVADSRRVKSTTRAAVLDYMKTIALTARQVTKTDSVSSRF